MRFVILLPILLLLPWIVDLASRVRHREHVPSQSVVLVTGAGRGVGLGLALHLASQGVLVIAGVRSPADFKTFSGNPNVKPILLDMASQAHASQALTEVTSVLKSTGKSFAGVVANAALLFRIPCEYETEEQERKVFDVNYFGTVRLIRTFLPLLMAHQGRAIIVGSTGATMTVPFLSTYTATKAALIAYTNSLRAEVEHQGVAVTYVSLGGVKTDMLATAAAGDSYNGTAYARLSTKLLQTFQQAEALCATTEQIAPEMANLIFTRYPPCISHMGIDAKIALGLSYLFPQRLMQNFITTEYF